jgi:quercetin dioxygenase-like cupin family protein
MARAGDSFENTLTGVTGTVLAGSEDTGGGLHRSELRLAPGARLLPPHSHPAATERLRVVSGRIRLRSGGAERALGPGDEAEIAAGATHDWWNEGDAEARVVIDLEPGGRFEELMTTMLALADEGRTNAAGTPHLLQLAVVLRAYGDVLRLSRVPRPLATAVLGPLAAIGRLHGYRAVYAREDTPHCQVARGTASAVEHRRRRRGRPARERAAGPEVVAA